MLGRLPPFLHVQHGGILHAIVEHLPPESKWCPWWHHLLIPVWLWLLVPLPRSLGLPSHLLPRLRIPTGMAGGHLRSVCCCPGFPCPQVCLEGIRALCAAAQAPHAHRYAWGAPRFCVLGGSPSGPVTLPFPPMLPFSPMAPQLSGLSACSLCCPVSQRLSLLTLQDSSL